MTIQLTDTTRLIVGNDTESIEATWREICLANDTDPDTIEEVREQLLRHGYAHVGGGAEPHIFITRVDDPDAAVLRDLHIHGR